MIKYNLPGVKAMPYPLESSSPPTCMRSQFLSIWYWMEFDSMRYAYWPSEVITLQSTANYNLTQV
jgi:hypothetical protein